MTTSTTHRQYTIGLSPSNTWQKSWPHSLPWQHRDGSYSIPPYGQRPHNCFAPSRTLSSLISPHRSDYRSRPSTAPTDPAPPYNRLIYPHDLSLPSDHSPDRQASQYPIPRRKLASVAFCAPGSELFRMRLIRLAMYASTPFRFIVIVTFLSQALFIFQRKLSDNLVRNLLALR